MKKLIVVLSLFVVTNLFGDTLNYLREMSPQQKLDFITQKSKEQGNPKIIFLSSEVYNVEGDGARFVPKTTVVIYNNSKKSINYIKVSMDVFDVDGNKMEYLYGGRYFGTVAFPSDRVCPNGAVQELIWFMPGWDNVFSVGNFKVEKVNYTK